MTPKQFEEWLEDHSFTGDCEEELAVEVSDVRALYAALRPRWVPVSERLPTHDGHYAVIWSDESTNVEIAAWRSRRWQGVSEGNQCGITHWSKLPPLPEES